MIGYFVFPALAGLLAVVMQLSSFHYVSIFFLVLLLIRLIYLNHKQVAKLSALAFIIFLLVAFWATANNYSLLTGEESAFALEVKVDTVTVDGDQLKCYARLQNGEKLHVFYRFRNQDDKINFLKQGPITAMHVTGELNQAQDHQNFFDFSYRSFLYRKNIHWVLEVDRIEGWESKFNIFDLSHWRQAVLNQVDRTFSDRSAPYVKALIFADRRYFNHNLNQQFKQLGVVHLLSISGMHLSFYISCLRYFLLRLGLTKEYLPKLLMAVLTLYGSLCGWGISVFRAICQSHLKSLRFIFNWNLTSLDIWSISLMFALMIQPMAIYQLGFQLSYGLSFALIFLNRMPAYHSLPAFKQSIFTSFYLGVWSILPLIIYQHSLPVLSVLFNLILIPLFSHVILPLLTLYYICSLWLGHTACFQAALIFLDFVLLQLESLAANLASFSSFTLVTGHLPVVSYLLIGWMLIRLMVVFEKDQHIKVKKLVFHFFILVLLLQGRSFSLATRVLFINVGQGDAMVVQAPFWKKTFMIDTGGRMVFDKEDWQQRAYVSNMAERTLIPALHALGISHLDYLYISHGDTDHSGEMLHLIQQFPVKQVVVSSQSLHHPSFLKDLKKIDSSASLLRLLEAASLPTSIDKDWHIIWPTETVLDPNEGSLVIYGKIGQDYWLFTGDIGREIEGKLMKRYPRLKVDVLKVAHHGSDSSTDSAWLDQLQPHTAIISVGEDNAYNHPSPAVIERLEEKEITTYRTDQDGAILFTYYPWSQQPRIQTVKYFYGKEDSSCPCKSK